MKKSSKRGITSVVSEAFIISIIVAIGLFVWGIAFSNAQVNRLYVERELNDELHVLNSAVEIEYAYYPMGIAALRNIGERTVIVIQLIVYEDGKLAWLSEISNITMINPGEVRLVSFKCPGCKPDSPKLLVVYYLPLELYSKYGEDILVKPVSDVIYYKVESGRIYNQWFRRDAGICPPPTGLEWAIVDFVEPLAQGANDRLAGPVKIRIPISSDSAPVETTLRILGAEGGGVGEKVIEIPSNVEDTIPTSAHGARFPVTVSIGMEEGWSVIQGEWVLGAYRIDSRRYAYVDSVKLIWNSDNKMITGGFIKIFIRYRGPVQLNYTISINIYDCRGEEISEGELNAVTRIGFGDYGLWEERYVKLDRQVSLFDAYRVEIGVRIER